MAQQLYRFLQKETNLDSFVVPSKQRIIQNISTVVSKIRVPLSILRWKSIFVCKLLNTMILESYKRIIYIMNIHILYQTQTDKLWEETNRNEIKYIY